MHSKNKARLATLEQQANVRFSVDPDEQWELLVYDHLTDDELVQLIDIAAKGNGNPALFCDPVWGTTNLTQEAQGLVHKWADRVEQSGIELTEPLEVIRRCMRALL